MTTEEFVRYAQEQGWHCVSNGAFGVYRGYPFDAIFQAGGAGCVTVRFKVEGKLNGAFLRGLRKALPKGCTLVPTNTAGVVVIRCPGKDASVTALLAQVMDLAVGRFQEGQLTVPDTCPICKQGHCNGLAFLRGGYVPTHLACVEGQTQATLDKAERETVSGNYVTGLIGALLGGVVGTIPNVLAAVWAERVVALLYALIPICAYYGYKLLRGKMNRGAFVCTLVASVVNLFVMQYIQVYVLIAQRLNFFSPRIVLQLYWDMLTGGNLTADLVQSAIFLALGLWISWSVITRTAKQDAHAASAVAATVQPYDPVRTAQTGYSPSNSYQGPELDEK